jgi:hypothetical protein
VHLTRAAGAAAAVFSEDRTGYERTKFRRWIGAAHDACNTRAEVLIEEAVTGPLCQARGAARQQARASKDMEFSTPRDQVEDRACRRLRRPPRVNSPLSARP